MKKLLQTKIKEVKAITLIALVVTIVILLIISTVAITLLVNNNLMEKAKLATDKYNNSVEIENYELSKLHNETENLQSSRADVQVSGIPLGTIIAYYNTTAPDGYLACDGAEYNLSEHPEYRQLATFLGVEEDATTFTAPDLKGEFLRGAGTNTHVNDITGAQEGSGSNVGEHQTATSLPTFGNYQDRTLYIDTFASSENNGGVGNYDTWTSKSGTRYYKDIGISTGSGGRAVQTIRPTNTSVLYCIKY